MKHAAVGMELERQLQTILATGVGQGKHLECKDIPVLSYKK